MSSSPHPKWWQLYLIIPLLIVLFLLDHRLKISTREHEAVQIGIVLFVYGLIYLWIKANRSSISYIDREQNSGRTLIIQVSPPRLPEPPNGKKPILQIPNSEVKGMLSTTYEMDCIDVEALPIEEVSKEKNTD